MAASCQVTGLVLALDHWETTLFHLAAADLVLATLVVVYRKLGVPGGKELLTLLHGQRVVYDLDGPNEPEEVKSSR